MMLQEIKDKTVWQAEVSKIHKNDFYFSFTSHQQSDTLITPILLRFSIESYIIILPILKREIKGIDYFDVTSVYGYTGPISSEENLPEKITIAFKEALESYFVENNIISVFSRLHPLMNQDSLLSGLGNIIELSQTISIDLTLPINEQRRQYRKGVKSDLSKLRGRNLDIIQDNSREAISTFIEIYNENMRRVNAQESYFFEESYYTNLLEADDIDAKLFFVLDNGRAIAASIFVFTGEIIQYHLSGTRSDALQNSPIRLLIDHIRLLGTDLGYKYLHLGGGVGSAEDALYDFKAGFSKQRHVFKLWKYIVNQNVYDSMVSDLNIKQDDGYFPLYRSTVKSL